MGRDDHVEPARYLPLPLRSQAVGALIEAFFARSAAGPYADWGSVLFTKGIYTFVKPPRNPPSSPEVDRCA